MLVLTRVFLLAIGRSSYVLPTYLLSVCVLWQDPSNAKYTNYLTRDELDALVGPPGEAVGVIVDYLRSFDVEDVEASPSGTPTSCYCLTSTTTTSSHHLVLATSYYILHTYLLGDMLRATTTVATAELLLNTEYYTFVHNTSGQEANRALAYKLPENIAKIVSFVSPAVRLPPITVKKIRYGSPSLVFSFLFPLTTCMFFLAAKEGLPSHFNV